MTTTIYDMKLSTESVPPHGALTENQDRYAGVSQGADPNTAGASTPGIGGPSFMSGASHFTVSQMTIKTITNNNYLSSPPALSDGRYLEDVISWLARASFINVFKTALEQRMEGTGEWFLKRPEFRQLLDGSSVVLWATGQPGSGKTVISALSIETLRQAVYQNNCNVAVLFAFIRYTDKLSAQDILASLLSQLLMASGKLTASLKDKYSTCKLTGETLTVRELTYHLRESVEQCTKVVIALDGLDEASDDVQETLLEILPHLGGNLLITSRPLPLLDHHIPSALRVPIQALTADIDLFVRGRIAKNSRLRAIVRGKPSLVDDICARVKEQSDGMFLLARLQMEVLETKPNTLKGLKSALEDLPRGLDAMYDQTLQRILAASDGGALGKRALVWLAHIQKRISIEDLQCALSTSWEDLTYDEDELAPVEILLGACCGLVEVRSDQEIVSRGWYRDCDEVRFVHYTTLEFVLRRLDVLGIQNPHALISATCLVHVQIHIDAFPGLPNFIGCGADFEALQVPMLVYSYQNWGKHARLSCDKTKGGGQLHTSVASYIQKVTDFPVIHPEMYRYPSPPMVNGLHLCAQHNLVELIQDRNLPLQTVTKHNFTPFHAAAFFGAVDSLLALLEAGYTGLHTADSNGYTPLHIAVVRLLPAVVEELLFPSLCATPKSDLALAQLRKVQVNALDCNGKTPLIHASIFGPSLGFLLRRPDIDVNIQDNDGTTALMTAARARNKESCKALLSIPGIKCDAQDNEGRTALMWAYISCQIETETGHKWEPSIRVRDWKLADFDLHLLDNKGLSALEHACFCCNILDFASMDSQWYGSPEKLTLADELAPIDYILKDGAGEWTPDEICDAAITVMFNWRMYRQSRVAPRVALLLLRLMQTCSGVIQDDRLGIILLMAASMPCTSCLAAVLSALGGPRISFLDECGCHHCSWWDLEQDEKGEDSDDQESGSVHVE